MRKSLHFIASITLTRFVSHVVGPIYNIQPSKPNKGRIIQPKDSATWQVTLDYRDNEPVCSVATNGLLFWGSTFRIKCTKVPLLLQAISYLGEAGRKSLGLKCSGRLWASKFLIKFHPTLSSFVKQRVFENPRFNEQSFII